MLTEKELIFFGAIQMWTSPVWDGNMERAVMQAKKLYDKIFNEDDKHSN